MEYNVYTKPKRPIRYAYFQLAPGWLVCRRDRRSTSRPQGGRRKKVRAAAGQWQANFSSLLFFASAAQSPYGPRPRSSSWSSPRTRGRFAGNSNTYFLRLEKKINLLLNIIYFITINLNKDIFRFIILTSNTDWFLMGRREGVCP